MWHTESTAMNLYTDQSLPLNKNRGTVLEDEGEQNCKIISKMSSYDSIVSKEVRMNITLCAQKIQIQIQNLKNHK